MKVREIARFLDERFPLALQEKYDNAGGQVMFPDEEVRGVMVALDCDRGVVEEAAEKSVNLIVTHHPLLFSPLKALSAGDPRSEIIFKLVTERVSLYAAHTNLDKVYYDKLAGVLDLKEPRLCVETDGTVSPGHEPRGFGVVGTLPAEMTVSAVLDALKRGLDLEYLVYSGDPGKTVGVIALVNGSAGRMTEKIIRDHGPHCIVTGDVGYHHLKTAADYGVTVIDAGHYGTEKPLLNFLRREIQDCLTKSGDENGIKAAISETERNPFRLYK
ncbi:MAG TPA: Nif3-like dinuclear metal center hexameric protein [Spirochaetes bacterium]|nr:Nif3-like dinuclear metal center hexameric protein [Spirochaetota bacterium]